MHRFKPSLVRFKVIFKHELVNLRAAIQNILRLFWSHFQAWTN